ncbi:hypothetical protein ACOME3_001990 [Neoechinorhynchus agilis]
MPSLISRFPSFLFLRHLKPIQTVRLIQTTVDNAVEKTELDIETYEQDLRTFARLFRHSKLVQLGGIKHRRLYGTVIDIVDGTDVYVDFGGKFHCTCHLRVDNDSSEDNKGGKRRGLDVSIGSRVVIKLKDFEMSARFLGASKDITLLEADAHLIGLVKDLAKKSVLVEDLLENSEK